MTGQGPRGTLMMAYSPDRFVGEIGCPRKVLRIIRPRASPRRRDRPLIRVRGLGCRLPHTWMGTIDGIPRWDHTGCPFLLLMEMIRLTVTKATKPAV